MNRKTRTILFLSLMILFLAIAPLTVFYSLGWRINWETKKISQPGTFYFKVQPRSTEVYLNGEIKEKTDFFFGSAFIENIIPGKYEVEIKKEGFQNWRKMLEINKGQVTEAKNIILFPKNPFFNIIGQESEGLSPALMGLGLIKKPENIQIPEKLSENIITHLVFENTVYYLDKSGFITKTGISFQGGEKLNVEPIKIIEEAKYQIKASPRDIALKQGETLYLLDKAKKLFKKISDSVKDFSFSPDFKKLVYFNNNEIWVLFLEKKYEQPQKELKDKIFLTRFSKNVDKLFWLTNYYLLFNTENEIKIIEIDDRDEINIINLAEFSNPEIYWDYKNKKLYLLSNQILYLSEQLIP